MLDGDKKDQRGLDVFATLQSSAELANHTHMCVYRQNMVAGVGPALLTAFHFAIPSSL